MAEGTGTK